MTNAYIQAAALTLEQKIVLEAMRADLASTATTGAATTTALTLVVKYLDAVTGPKYHMLISARSSAAAALAAFVDSANPTAGESTAMYTRANLMKTDLLAHMAAVGTRVLDAEHKAADTALAATLTAVPAATTLGTVCTLAIALGVAFIGHGNSAGVHYHDDAVAAAYSVSSNLLAGNATANKARIELNAILVAMATHFANGTA